MLTRLFEKIINIITNRKDIQFKNLFLKAFFDIFIKRIRILIIIIFVKIELSERNVKKKILH